MDYESEILRDWYLLFHYGSSGEILAGSDFGPGLLPPGCLEFPLATVRAASLEGPIRRALDLGCAVGRSTFELSGFADETVGIDFSSGFVEAAETLRNCGEVAYRRWSEGHLRELLTARRPGNARPDRVRFETGDAMDLRSDLGSFDLVHAANLLCRLSDPVRLLERLPDLVKRGGRLVLATPASWSGLYTPGESQPPGQTLDFLDHHLGGTFERLAVSELPFLMREHQRKFQLSTSQTSLWRRR